MSPAESPDARHRLLDAAENLFASRGFDSVRMRDIAEALGLTHAALYYHFPGGKEELFAEVMERNIRRHGEGLAAALEAGGPRLRGRLRGAASWLLSQPPMDLIRMAESDLKKLPPEKAGRIMGLVYELVLFRLQGVFEAARASGEVGPCDPGLLAGGVVGLVESLHSVPVSVVGRDRYDMACDLIDVLLKGIEYKEGETQCQ
jgi:TetR/AcrR family transcriptional regulator, cholesterol catabolism regulator